MAFSTDDTIVALATPAGRGAIGVVRLSGADAVAIARALTGRARPFAARRATFARVTAGEAAPGAGPAASDARPPAPEARREGVCDQVVVTFFPGPASYTGEDVVEIAAHGSPVVLAGIVDRAVACGARIAEPGEFTLRAFLHGKLDLVQAEAVADLVDAVTPLQARCAFDQLEGTLTQAIARIEQAVFDVTARLEASLDFPDEGYHFTDPGEAAATLTRAAAEIDRLLEQRARGRLVREGAEVVIAGRPNVGKSSLFNALLHASRAIVTDVPGTTRDLLTERVELGGLLMTLVDTAGLHEATDAVEREGVTRTRRALEVADLVLVVLDASRPLHDTDRALLAQVAARPHVVVANKADLPRAWRDIDRVEMPTPAAATATCDRGHPLPVSATSGEGLDALVSALVSALSGGEERRDPPLVTNVRHMRQLEQARAALARAIGQLEARAPEELALADLLDASRALQEVTGQRTTDDLLRQIFERFCIGK